MLFYFPPFFQAASAAGRRRVLGDEDRVSLHGRLLPVVYWLRHSQSLANEILGVPPDRSGALLGEIPSLRGRKMEPRPKLRPRQLLERLFPGHISRKQFTFYAAAIPEQQ